MQEKEKENIWFECNYRKKIQPKKKTKQKEKRK